MKRRLALALLACWFGFAGQALAQERKPAPAGTTAAGAPGEARWPFRIVIVPDSQRYTTDRVFASDPGKKGDTRKPLALAQRNAIWEQMMQWVADHAQKDNIRLLLHVGDIVEKGGDKSQYEMIAKGIARLDGNVPYVLAVGNHDNARLASEFFPVSRNPLNVKMFGGARTDGLISDLYATLTINGRKYLILTLDSNGYARNPADAARDPRLKWANDVVKDHPDCKVIFVTHQMLADAAAPGGTPSFITAGNYLFENFLKKHANVYMTFCGHVFDRSGDGIATGYRKDLGEAKNVIHSTLLDTQWIAATGGDGWMRIVEFYEDGRVVFKTYSPYLNEWNRGPGLEFEIPAVPAATAAPAAPAIKKAG